MKMRMALMVGVAFAGLMTTGCGMKPFEPVLLETVKPQEEGFLIPLWGDTDKQTAKRSVDPAKVTAEEGGFTAIDVKQVKIPHRWVETGYNFPWSIWINNGKWEPSATLITVDRSPVTREWSFEENRGTSKTDQAIWVMTADQVEFSTGWTATARIESKADAAKFLYNYRNKTLADVLDGEIRGQVQTKFSLEVTDLPMEKLRNDATPHITKVVKDVTEFFKTRGISITNLGISGGFVYKNESIGHKIVELFNAEQEAAIAKAHVAAQAEENKKIQLAAEAKSKAILTEREAEAKGIQAVADAKAYEITKAQENKEIYLELKRLELSTKQAEKWDGRFPQWFSGGQSPAMLLNVGQPTVSPTK
jgi:regulator of protease activity HflC (stomatin/prohibitin superfamily)